MASPAPGVPVAAAAAASAATPAAPSSSTSSSYAWPWIQRDPDDMPSHARDKMVQGLPEVNPKKPMPPFQLDIDEDDRSFHGHTHTHTIQSHPRAGRAGPAAVCELAHGRAWCCSSHLPSLLSAWNTFRSQRRDIRKWEKSASIGDRLKAAMAYHELGQALEANHERAEHWAEARSAYERDYVLSRSLPRPHESVIPALRHMSVCADEQGHYPQSVRYAEQALTEAILARDPEERQGAYVALGLVCQHWLHDAGNDPEYDRWGLRERQQLTERVCHYFTRALKLADELKLSKEITASKRCELRRNANINMSNGIEQRIEFIALQTMQDKRRVELDRELDEEHSALYAETATPTVLSSRALLRTDQSTFVKTAVFKLENDAPPAVRAMCLEARRYLRAAEDLCFADESIAAAAAKEVLRPLPYDELEIDEAAPFPDGVQVENLSIVLHTHGMVLERVGLLDDAVTMYVMSARRLNCLRTQAELKRSVFDRLVDGQTKSLKNALLVYIKLGNFRHARKMALQLKKLAKRAIAREEKKPTGCMEDLLAALEESESFIQLVQSKEQSHKQLQRIDADLSKWQPDQDPELHAKLALVTQRRDHFTGLVQAGNECDDEWTLKGVNTQHMLNCERNMWRIIREQRKLIDPKRQPDRWRDSLQREGKLLISIAQSTSALCGLLFGNSPAKNSERQLCTKYWQLVRDWFRVVLSSKTALGRPLWGWQAVTLINHANSLQDDLRGMPRDVLMLRLEASKCMDECVRRGEGSDDAPQQLLKARVDLAEQIASDFAQRLTRSPSDARLQESTASWSNKHQQLQLQWSRLQQAAAKDLKVRELVRLNEAFQELFEGEKEATLLAEGDGGAATASTVLKEEEAQPVAIVSPPSSKPLHAAAAPPPAAIVKLETPATKTIAVTPIAPSPRAHAAKPSTASVAPSAMTAAAKPATSVAMAVKVEPRAREGDHIDIMDLLSSERQQTAASRAVAVAPAPVAVAAAAAASAPAAIPSVAALRAEAIVLSSQSRMESIASVSSSSSASAPVAAGHAAVGARKRRRILMDGSESPDEFDDEDLLDVTELEPQTGSRAQAEDLTADAERGQEEGQQPARKKPHLDGAAAAADSSSSAQPVPAAISASRPDAQTAAAMSSSASSHSADSIASLPSAASRLLRDALLSPPQVQPAVSSLGHVSICDEGMEELVVALRKLRQDSGQVQQLTLQRDRFTDASVAELKTVMTMRATPSSGGTKPLAFVTSLDMSFSNVEGDAGWSHLLVAMPKLPRLRSLDLSFTAVGSWCPDHLHACIKRAPMLRVLHLDGCSRVTGHGSVADEAQRLASALTSNPCLEELSLRGCRLTPMAISALLRSIRASAPQLHTLSLSYVRVMCYRLSVGQRLQSAPVPDSEDGPWTNAEDALSAWRYAMHTHALLCADDAALLRDVYTAMREWLTDTHPAAQRNVTLALNGWSNGLRLSDTLVEVLRCDAGRLHQLQLCDTDMSATHATDMANALKWNARESQSLRRLAFHTLLPEPHKTAVHRAITTGVPAVIQIDLSSPD